MGLDDLFALNDVRHEDKEARFLGYLRMDPLTPEGYQEMLRLLDDLGMSVAAPMIREEQQRQGAQP